MLQRVPKFYLTLQTDPLDTECPIVIEWIYILHIKISVYESLNEFGKNMGKHLKIYHDCIDRCFSLNFMDILHLGVYSVYSKDEEGSNV